MENIREQKIAEAVEQLLDEVKSTHYDSQSEESFTECHVCGEWESHKDNCFVPVLEKWLSE